MGIFEKLFGTKMKDPVCGMEVNPETAKAKIEKEGESYYFCSTSCREKFVSGKFEKHKEGCC